MSWHAISRGWRNRKKEDRLLLAKGKKAKNVLKSILITAKSQKEVSKATIDYLACIEFLHKIRDYMIEAKDKMLYKSKLQRVN